jgi:hypothetical protein
MDLAGLRAPRFCPLGGHVLQPIGSQHTLERRGACARERFALRQVKGIIPKAQAAAGVIENDCILSTPGSAAVL